VLLVRLAAALILVAGLAKLAHALTTLVVILALVSFILAHELGHLIMAKRAGMKVTQYFAGFGPTLWSVRRGETEYGIKAIPAGGYVRIVGMNNLDPVAPEDEPRSYREQSFPKRLSVAVAGSTVHFLIAIVLLWFLFSPVGVPKALPRIHAVEGLTTGPSPAQVAGFQPGDTFVSVDGQPVASWDSVVAYIQAHAGQRVSFVVRRQGALVPLSAVPADLSKVTPQDRAGSAAANGTPTKPVGFLGVTADFTKERINPVRAVGRSVTEFGREVGLAVEALVHILSPHGISTYGHQLFNGPSSGASAENRPVGPVGIVRFTNQVARSGGASDVLIVLAALNIFIGVFNLIPLLPFDGGLVAIAIYERLRSTRERRYHADVARLLPVTYTVVLFLILLFMSTLYLDVTRPL
jgi:membrane-associated protease RseP (regulator of RpoE activity)